MVNEFTQLGLNFNPGTKEVAKNISQKGFLNKIGRGIGVAGEYAPFVGNAIDYALGTDQFRKGNIPAGLAYYGLGTAGTLADIGSILSAPATAGAGTAGIQAGKIAGKATARKALSNIIKNKTLRDVATKASVLNTSKNKLGGREARTIYTTLLALGTGNNKDKPKGIPDKSKSGEEGSSTNNRKTSNNLYTNSLPQGNTNIDDTINNTGGNNMEMNLDAILDLYNKQYEAQQPYLEALGNFINDYKGLQEDAMIRDRGNVALAGLSGNEGYKQLVGRYNPATIEADRINLLNTLANVEAQRAGGLNELIGNIAIAEEMGLPPESAFGNKNLLTALGAYNRALYGLEGRKYTADINRDIQLALMAGRRDLALTLQQLKNAGGLERAFVGSAGYGDIDNLINAMRMMGYDLKGNNPEGSMDAYLDNYKQY